MPMMAITTNSSIRVKAERLFMEEYPWSVRIGRIGPRRRIGPIGRRGEEPGSLVVDGAHAARADDLRDHRAGCDRAFGMVHAESARGGGSSGRLGWRSALVFERGTQPTGTSDGFQATAGGIGIAAPVVTQTVVRPGHLAAVTVSVQ